MARRFTAVAVLGLTLACSEDATRTLDERDGGPFDGAVPVDAGADAGLDAGADAGRDASTLPACRSRPMGLLITRVAADGSERPLEDLVADATVIEIEPLVLALDDGTLLRVQLGANGPSVTDDIVGLRLRARLGVYRPFWTEARLVLLDRGRELFAAFWDGSSWGTGNFPGVNLAHVDAACRSDDDTCGKQIGRAARFGLPAGFIGVDPGEVVEADGTVFANGESARYVEGPLCTDTPDHWYQGFIWTKRDVDDCDAVARDACLVSPDCALHGSLDRDPGYACHVAAEDCERLDALGCRARPDRCVWDPGECYCPEGAVCACGDGPPPVCRRRCDPRTDEMSCADNYFYQLSPGAAGAICTPSFDDGQCVRVPSSCEGTPPAPDVCGCPEVTTGGRPARFDDDCGRRRNRAFEVPLAWCEP